MNKYTIPLTLYPVEIVSVDSISTKLLASLERFAGFIQLELNHKRALSLVERFNTQEPYSLLKVPKEFTQFLDLHLAYQAKFPKDLKLCLADFKIDETLYHWSHGFIQKLRAFKIDTSVLKNAFLVDTITSFLLKNKKNNFIVKGNRFFRASGQKKWKVNIDFEEGLVAKQTIGNTALGAFWNASHKEGSKLKNFGYIEDSFVGNFYTIKSNCCTDSAVLFELLKSLQNKMLVREFVSQHGCSVNIITKDLETLSFVPRN